MIAGMLAFSLGAVQPVAAAEYPSWAEVEQARSSESAKQAHIAQITNLVEGLQEQVAAAEALVAQSATEYETAQASFDEATFRADALQQQAAGAADRATTSTRRAGALVAAWVRSGGADLSTTILLDPNSDDLLNTLTTIDRLTQSTNSSYDQAVTDQNAALAQGQQAAVARDALGALHAAAEQALLEVMQAQQTARATLDDQQEYAATLEAQLLVLREDRAATEADYSAGETARRNAAAAAAAAASGAGGQDGGQPSGQGWISPISGPITDAFGPRPNRPAGASPFHSGTDIGAGCYRTVVAASSGVVTHSGWLGTYGNWILIDHGNGAQTGYAHNSSLLVGEGVSVSAGTPIALVGTTGASTGCHSHFEVRVDGARVDAQPFMAARGARLG
ncbi:M23 family metallopeptidase [Plantibacter sp. RU18]|uniref:M23 family metallopeptidase n=1 Tax=Plantibacter sp. RU18 TaxID=3158143 RepID=UPI003D36E4FD